MWFSGQQTNPIISLNSFNANSNEWWWCYEWNHNGAYEESFLTIYCNSTLQRSLELIPREPNLQAKILHKSNKLLSIEESTRLLKISRL